MIGVLESEHHRPPGLVGNDLISLPVSARDNAKGLGIRGVVAARAISCGFEEHSGSLDWKRHGNLCLLVHEVRTEAINGDFLTHLAVLCLINIEERHEEAIKHVGLLVFCNLE